MLENDLDFELASQLTFLINFMTVIRSYHFATKRIFNEIHSSVCVVCILLLILISSSFCFCYVLRIKKRNYEDRLIAEKYDTMFQSSSHYGFLDRELLLKRKLYNQEFPVGKLKSSHLKLVKFSRIVWQMTMEMFLLL